MIIFLTLMYKTLGEFSWNGFFSNTVIGECPVSDRAKNIISQDDQTITESAIQFHIALENLKSVTINSSMIKIKTNLIFYCL